MYYVPFELAKIKRARRKYQKLFKFLDEFNDSGLECVQLKDLEYANLKSCQNSITAAIKKYKFTSIRCVIADGNVYLINESV